MWMSYEKACELVRRLGITSMAAYSEYIHSNERPIDLPKAPDSVYEGKGWKGYPAFFGVRRGYNFKGMKPRICRSFIEAREFVHGLGMINGKE